MGLSPRRGGGGLLRASPTPPGCGLDTCHCRAGGLWGLTARALLRASRGQLFRPPADTLGTTGPEIGGHVPPRFPPQLLLGSRQPERREPHLQMRKSRLRSGPAWKAQAPCRPGSPRLSPSARDTWAGFSKSSRENNATEETTHGFHWRYLSISFFTHFLKRPWRCGTLGMRENTPKPGVRISAGGALGRLPYLLEPQFFYL